MVSIDFFGMKKIVFFLLNMCFLNVCYSDGGERKKKKKKKKRKNNRYFENMLRCYKII